MSDPYQVLGLQKSASLDEIKKSYRKLAKKYHPDLNPGNKDAEKKFKELSHAFDLVGTKEAREKFDRGETDEQKQDMHDEYVRQQKSHGRQRPFYQQTQEAGGRYTSSFGEEMGDDDLFSSLFGSKGRQSAGGFDYAGEDQLYQLEVDFLEAAVGGEKVITLPSGKKLQVKIPAGIQPGQKLKFKGLGGEGLGKGAPGNAYVQISIKPSEKFQREGNDILSEVPVSFFEAILGGEIEVPTIDGSVMLKIPAGISTGARLRIRNKGAGTGDKRGNHIVVLKVVMPKDPAPELKEAMTNLADKFSYNPRTQL